MKRRSARRAAAALTFSLAAHAPAAGQDSPVACGPKGPPIPAFPADFPSPLQPPDYAPLRGMGTDVDLGIGAVGPADPPGAGEDWILAVRLPLFDSPGESLAGHVTGGAWVPFGGTSRPLGTEVMVETGYEAASWIALEEAAGSWIRLRFKPPGPDGDDGSAWASVCHLSASDPPLAFTRWEDSLGGLLFFRTRNAHALRAGPGIDYARRAWIRASEDPMLERLEIRGDWMRVRVTRPSTYCVDPVPPGGRIDEGWVRWRDDEMGPWVWIFTRGC